MDQNEALLLARYGEQEWPTSIIWNEQIKTLLSHKSVRSFTDEPLPDGALETIVAAAQSASSSSNQHLWSVIAVSDHQAKQKLANLTFRADTKTNGYSFVAEAPVVLLWVADLSRNYDISRSNGGDPQVTDYLDAFLMSSVDATIAAQNGLVAAEALGLGGVYLGSLRNNAEELAQLVNLPQHAFVVFGMAIGKPDNNRPSAIRPRPAQSVVLHHEKYTRDEKKDWIQMYEAATSAFRTKNNLRNKTWVESVILGSGFEYMDGRENLRSVVQDRGFGLN